MAQDIETADDPFDVDPDDELLPVTDPWVIETLGFDPLELATDDERQQLGLE
jgi:hypothetical protein